MAYYSWFIEILNLVETTSQVVIQKLKSVFARWGIPEELVRDNGTQVKSAMFDEFKAKYGFKHHMNPASPPSKWCCRKCSVNLQTGPETAGSIPCSHGLPCNPYPSHWKDTIRTDHGKTDTYYSPNNDQGIFQIMQQS